jgi:hypothetical protein
MISWLDRKLGPGLYTGPVRRLIDWADRCLSLNSLFKRFIRTRLSEPEGTKTPSWVSEFYQLLSFAVAILLLLVARFAPPWAGLIGAAVALYRPFEIFLFAVAWVFIHTDPLHSYKRSLAGFITNLAEVVVFFAAAYLGFGLIERPAQMSTALYSSLRTTVTIGPAATADPPNSWLGGTLLIAQIVVSYFLTIVVIASVVGALRKRDEARNRPVV